MGEGTEVGRRQFMEWGKENHPDIRAVGLSTGWSAAGHWVIRNVEGKAKNVQMLLYIKNVN